MDLTIEQLQEKLNQIREACDYWKGCKDGSYEMALHSYGYNDYSKELGRLLDAQEAANGHQ